MHSFTAKDSHCLATRVCLATFDGIWRNVLDFIRTSQYGTFVLVPADTGNAFRAWFLPLFLLFNGERLACLLLSPLSLHCNCSGYHSLWCCFVSWQSLEMMSNCTRAAIYTLSLLKAQIHLKMKSWHFCIGKNTVKSLIIFLTTPCSPFLLKPSPCKEMFLVFLLSLFRSHPAKLVGERRNIKVKNLRWLGHIPHASNWQLSITFKKKQF